jgi:S-adenosylmethionine synthetase
MEEQERVVSQVFERNSDNIPSAREPCMSVSYAPFGLAASRP